MNAYPRLVESEVRAEDIRFPADQAVLSGRLFQPGAKPRAAIVLHGATAVPHGFYRGFAEWLAGEGYAVLTYDYRDFGASANGSLRASKATMAVWGTEDQPAAQTELERRVPGVPVWVIGHSFGGLMLPFQAGAKRVERVIGVASGLVHLGDHPWPYRAAAAAFWYGPGPVATAAMGYMPGRFLGSGAALPPGVYWQWRRWCTSHGFWRRDVGLSLPQPDLRAITAPVKLVAIADDDVAPSVSVWRTMTIYPEAMKRQLTLRPWPGSKIGHMGAFRRSNAALWPQIIA